MAAVALEAEVAECPNGIFGSSIAWDGRTMSEDIE